MKTQFKVAMAFALLGCILGLIGILSNKPDNNFIVVTKSLQNSVIDLQAKIDEVNSELKSLRSNQKSISKNIDEVRDTVKNSSITGTSIADVHELINDLTNDPDVTVLPDGEEIPQNVKELINNFKNKSNFIVVGPDGKEIDAKVNVKIIQKKEQNIDTEPKNVF